MYGISTKQKFLTLFAEIDEAIQLATSCCSDILDTTMYPWVAQLKEAMVCVRCLEESQSWSIAGQFLIRALWLSSNLFVVCAQELNTTGYMGTLNMNGTPVSWVIEAFVYFVHFCLRVSLSRPLQARWYKQLEAQERWKKSFRHLPS